MDTGPHALTTALKKLVHKVAEATSEFIGNNIADKIVKSKHVIDENLRTIEEIIIPSEKREKF